MSIINKHQLSDRALAFTAEYLQTTVDSLQEHTVSGGFSLNRRAVVALGDKSVFVKEVDVSFLDGDGQEEKGWLAKDHALMELLRSEQYHTVPSWSVLSGDKTRTHYASLYHEGRLGVAYAGKSQSSRRIYKKSYQRNL
jgi:hypothetical protein